MQASCTPNMKVSTHILRPINFAHLANQTGAILHSPPTPPYTRWVLIEHTCYDHFPSIKAIAARMTKQRTIVFDKHFWSFIYFCQLLTVMNIKNQFKITAKLKRFNSFIISITYKILHLYSLLQGGTTAQFEYNINYIIYII